MQAVLRFRAFDSEQVPIAQLPERIRRCVEGHPTLSFRLDGLEVFEEPRTTTSLSPDRLRHMRARITGDEVSSPEEDLLDARDLLGEVERLRRWIADLQSGMSINCVYCGHRYGPDPGTPIAMAEVLKKHVEVCPEHPMSTLRTAARTLLDASNAGREAIGRVLAPVLAIVPPSERGYERAVVKARTTWEHEQPVFEARGRAATALAEVLDPPQRG